MKNVVKKFLAAFLAVGMVSSIAVSSAFAASSSVVVGNHSISNEYICVYTEGSDDTYYLHTTGGDPNLDSDNNKRLLYDGTSKTYYSVDGTAGIVYGYDEVIDEDSKSISLTYTKNNMKFERVMTIIPNNVTGREDTVEYKLVVTNEDDASHNVGARIMLDTMLGENDYAPFRLSSIGELTTRLQLTGDDIPAMFQAFDSLSNPTVIGTGSFATGMGKPDIVQFMNWRVSNNSVLVPECNESLTLGDSAVNAIWNEKELKAGESRIYKTYYGLGEIQRSTESELVLGASKIESNFEINEDGTGYKPVSLMGYVENNGTETLNDVVLEISCDDGVTVSQGEEIINVGSLGVGKTSQGTWTLSAEPSYEERTVKVLVKATSSETGDVRPIEYTYTLPAIERPTEEPTEAPTVEPTVVPTETPTVEPTIVPTEAPTVEPTVVPTGTTTVQPTVAPTGTSTVQPTVKVTSVATAATAATVAPANVTVSNTTGKVATGQSTNVIMLLVSLLGVAGLVSFVNRKREK